VHLKSVGYIKKLTDPDPERKQAKNCYNSTKAIKYFTTKI